KQEVDRLGIEMVAPCVNRSDAVFSVAEGRILYGLGALKNVGVEAMRLIVAARGTGQFADLFDLARRVDLRRVGKRPLEMLARAGAFDCLDGNRRKVFESLDALVAFSGSAHDEAASAQISMFGTGGADLPAPRLPMPEDWWPNERLGQEHQAVGFYLSGHPLDDYMGALRRSRVLTLADVTAKAASGPVAVRMAGSVAARQERKSARGTRFAFVQMSDPTGLFEVTVFSDTLDDARDLLEPGQNVVMAVEATLESDQVKLLARSVQPVDQAVAGAAPAGLKVFVNDAAALPSVALRLEDAPGAPARSHGPVNLILVHPDLPGDVEIELPKRYPVTPGVRSAIKHIAGVVYVEEF
ncbi:MAG: DNA polymerase III subunit alpha, partial [Pseudomonadota bacterium]